jgi:DNA-binding MarR family transcriptional regulator
VGTNRDEEVIVIPALLRAARGSYAQAIVRSLAAAGFADLPQNGPFVLGGIANHGATSSDMVEVLGISKQRASQLIDILVLRGYLTREIDVRDRRRMVIGLTERGLAAGKVVRGAVEQVDAELAQMISPAEMAGLRVGLTALGHIKEATKEGP